MSFKQGGVSWNGNPRNKKPKNTNTYKCSICGRYYHNEMNRNRHEEQCRQYEEAKRRRQT